MSDKTIFEILEDYENRRLNKSVARQLNEALSHFVTKKPHDGGVVEGPSTAFGVRVDSSEHIAEILGAWRKEDRKWRWIALALTISGIIIGIILKVI